MLLHWSDIYKTGHPGVDKQHKEIIDAMNSLHDAVMDRKDKDAVTEMIGFLNTYTKQHFAYEERCIEEFQCPHAAENKQAHQKFLKLLDDASTTFATEQYDHSQVLDFYYEIVFWIKDHILEVDKNNFQCVGDKLREKFGLS